MPTPRTIDTYPAEFRAFMTQVFTTGDAKLNVPTRRIANTWRKRVYAYRDAMLHDERLAPLAIANARALRTSIRQLCDNKYILHLYIKPQRTETGNARGNTVKRKAVH